MASIIKVDQLSEKTQGSGITLSHSLKNSSGSEIINSSGSIGSAVDFANIANDSISGDKIHSGTISSSTLDGIKLKSSGDSITKSDGTTAVLSESVGVVTLNNITAGSNISGIGQLIGMSFSNALNTNGNIVTLESSKSYDALLMMYSTAEVYYFIDLAFATVDSSGNVTVGKYTTFASGLRLESTQANQVYIRAYGNSGLGYSRALFFERGSTFDAS